MKSTILNEDSKRLLLAAFGQHAPDVWVCWKGNMKGKRVRDLKPEDLPKYEDCYFCPALIKMGALSRSNANAKRVMVMVIDDVGTKIDQGAFDMNFPIDPSYRIESSRGNFQYGYFIEDGMEVRDYYLLRRAMKASPIWGHADGIDPVHLFRLPQGTNTKPEALGWEVKQ
jgi:hypothetical protein